METKVNKVYLTNPPKSSGHQAWVSFPGLQSSLHRTTHWCWEKPALSLTPLGEDNWKLELGILLDPAQVPLPLMEFNLYPFDVINPIYEYKYEFE